MTWEETMPFFGMQVTIDFPPGCLGEGTWHGIWPMVHGHKGVIEYFGDKRKGDATHIYWVRLDWDGRPNHSWFALTEMIPLEGAKPGS